MQASSIGYEICSIFKCRVMRNESAGSRMLSERMEVRSAEF